jgi:RNA polymerase sigma-B factor
MHEQPPAAAGYRSGTTAERERGPVSTDALQRRYARGRDPRDRAALVARHQGLAQSIAYRFCQHKHDLEDRMQIALLGLLNAVDRYDPDRGVSFSTFAWATIVGELKRFHRNSGWAAHVPRSRQELHLRTAAAVDYLTAELGRSPTLDDIAGLTGDSVEDVAEGIELNSVRQAVSLDRPVGDDDPDGRDVAVEAEYGVVETKLDVTTMLSRLSPRSREILRLRFVEGMSQSQIAARVGLSQMHISRLLAQALAVLRAASDN